MPTTYLKKKVRTYLKQNFTTKLPRTTLGTGLARTGTNTGTPEKEFYNKTPSHDTGHGRDWRALALTQVHHGSRLSDSCESGEALSSVHPPTPATGKLIHNLLCDCRVKND